MLIKVNAEGFVYDSSPQPCFLPPLNFKQFEIFTDAHRYLLAHGPRKSGKTFGLVHKCIKHAFDVDGAMAAIVAKTLKNAKSAGVWSLLCKMLPIWEKHCYGFKVVEGPKTTGDTKLSYVKIRNHHGTISEIQCHSLEHAKDVEEKFKGTAYSFFWLSELDQYCDEHAFDIICDALRMTPFVPYHQHQLVADCNPPDSGEDHWIYDRWFRRMEEKPEVELTEEEKVTRSETHQILVMIDDNPQLDPNEKRDLIARYKKRPGLYKRYILGEWVQDITDGHFSDVFDQSLHIVGNIAAPEPEWEVIIPTATCVSLLTGWDVGESKNHSFHILEKIPYEVELFDESTGKMHMISVVAFSVIDELVSVNKKISTREFVEGALEKMDHWSDFHKKRTNLPLTWRHWSDTSAFQFRAGANTTDAAIVYEASGSRVILNGAPKYSGSRRDRVKLVWQLMHEKRFFISAQLSDTRAMILNLRKGTKATDYIRNDRHKHPFDSLSYPIIAEAPIDMLRSSDVQTSKKQSSPGLIVASV